MDRNKLIQGFFSNLNCLDFTHYEPIKDVERPNVLDLESNTSSVFDDTIEVLKVDENHSVDSMIKDAEQLQTDIQLSENQSSGDL